MISVVIVEDDATKYGRVHNALVADGVEAKDIAHAVCVADALDLVRARRFDLMLLDVNLPRRLGEGPQRGGGLEVLRELARDDRLYRPKYIVGLTAYEDVLGEFGSAFDDHLWSLVHYTETSDRWVVQLRLRIEYIRATQKSQNFSDGVTYGVDLAIVCALEGVEFEAIRRLPCEWQPLRLPHDETRYLTGNITTDRATFSVLAAAAPRMGMPASSVLSAKIIHQFRPRFLAMVGICAGRVGKVKLGDIIVADPTWDWGSGKIISKDSKPAFLPAPHQLDLDTDLAPILKDVAEDRAMLALLKHDARGLKPADELSVRFEPLASGAAVVADSSTIDELLAQHRGLLGIDMETYAVFCAAMGSAKPRPRAMAIKAVSDYADQDKLDDYQEYAASVSAMFLLKAAKAFL
jgi:nucleoside phosphorylase/CheY-like chemotaxis protein